MQPGSLLSKDKGLATAVDADYIPDSVDITDFAVYAIPAPRVEVAVLEKAIDRELEAVVAKGASHPAAMRTQQCMQPQTPWAHEYGHIEAGPLGIALAKK